MQSEPKPSGERIRDAVIRGAYGEVERLLDVYRAEVETCWKVAGAEQRHALASEVTGLLQWARQTILATRAHTQNRLIRFSRQRAYLAGGGRRVDPLELDA